MLTVICPTFFQDKTKEPAYGADTLRLWAASVEPWRDMLLGSRSLAQTSETLRKLRNTVRFILGNVGDMEQRKDRSLVKADKSEMGLVDRYVMHELAKLEGIALEGYEGYGFPRGESSLIPVRFVSLIEECILSCHRSLKFRKCDFILPLL